MGLAYKNWDLQEINIQSEHSIARHLPKDRTIKLLLISAKEGEESMALSHFAPKHH